MSIPTTNEAWILPPRNPRATKASPLSLTRATLPKPTPGPHQVLIRIQSVSLNYSNLMVLTHTYPIPPRPSLIPGLDGAGTIEATGANSKWSAGDKVVVHHCNWLTGDVENLRFDTIIGAGENNGTLQRYMVLDDERVVRAPRNLSIEEAGTLHTAGATVVNALFWGARRAQRGDTVLTMGTGGVSCFAIQIASAIGATVIATSSSDEKLEIAKALGAKHVINYKTTPNWDEEVLRITGGRGVDYVIEVGGAQTIVKSLRSTRNGGIVSAIGLLSEGVPADVMPLIVLGAKTVRGSMSASREMLEELVNVVEEYDIHPYISKTFEFDQALEAFETLRKQTDVGKIVVKGA